MSNNQDLYVTDQDIDIYRSHGYENIDILPKRETDRNMNTLNYFTLWMGSIHNIPNYLAVGGFLALGLAPIHVLFAIILSGLGVALFLTTNGKAGSKYGIPFSMHLRAVYGEAGSKLPGFLRGGVAAIAWFGVQNYAGSQALLILIGRIWPDFLTIGGDMNILGLSTPAFISFVIFFFANLLIGLGGGGILNRFTAILNPLIYVVFGGMVIWGLSISGGIGNVLSYMTEATTDLNPIIAYLAIISSTIAVWAAPGVSVADFTQNATSTRAQVVGQTSGLLVGYIIYAFASIIVLNGASIIGVQHEGDILQIINGWDSTVSIFAATFVLLMTTISTNATGNIIPAAYQLTALFPKQMNYRRGVIVASIISFIIMPWRFMQSGSVILVFLNYIGSLLGPVGGVMVVHFYLIQKQQINLEQLYFSPDQAKTSQYSGLNKAGYIATIVGFVIAVIGQFVPALSVLSQISWIVGFFSAAIVYYVLKRGNV